MTNPVARHPSGFDYGFRPASYFDNLDPNLLIVASILGEERRKDVQERLATGNFDPLVWGPWLTESKLDDSIRQLIGRAHPQFMGGEYLPALEQDEIEIARIILASVMQEVTSLRARRSGKRIAYRVVSEHEQLRGFVSVSSCFYPDLARYYDEVVNQYLDEITATNEAQEEAA